MLCDCCVFPVRPSTYKKGQFKLYQIPRSPTTDTKIPVRLFENRFKSALLILYFHGNAEDIGNQTKFLTMLTAALGVISLIKPF